MATDKQIAANRRNAAKSTGPRTEDGKARSRMNALRHGLSAAQPAPSPRNVLATFERLNQIDREVIDILCRSNDLVDQGPSHNLATAVRRLAALQRYTTRTYSELKKQIRDDDELTKRTQFRPPY